MSSYTNKERDNIFTTICESIEEGNSLRDSVIDAEISRTTFYKWRDESKEKMNQYAHATKCRQDKLFEDLLIIADDELVEHQRSRLMVDTRKWVLSKMNPKKYGDKLQTENLNKVIDMSDLTDEELDEKIKQAKKVLGE